MMAELTPRARMALTIIRSSMGGEEGFAEQWSDGTLTIHALGQLYGLTDYDVGLAARVLELPGRERKRQHSPREMRASAIFDYDALADALLEHRLADRIAEALARIVAEQVAAGERGE